MATPRAHLTGGYIVQQKRPSTAALAFALSLAAGNAWAANPIAVADGERSGTRVDITEIKRTSGSTVTLKFTLVNESGGNLTVSELLDHNDARNVHLIDAVGKKKYMPMMDSGNKCVCSSSLPYSLASDKSLNLWVRFPAPPGSVREISVVIPHFIPTDVAIPE